MPMPDSTVQIEIDDLTASLHEYGGNSQIRVVFVQRLPAGRAQAVESAQKKVERVALGRRDGLDRDTRVMLEASINMECPRQPGNLLLGNQPYPVHVVVVWHAQPAAADQFNNCGGDAVVKIDELVELARTHNYAADIRRLIKRRYGMVGAAFAIADLGVKSAKRSRWFGTVPTNAYELTQMLHSMQPSNVTMFSPGKPEWQTEMNGAAALEQSRYVKRKAECKPRVSIGVRNNGSFHPAPGNILGPYSPRTIVQETFGGQHWAGQATDDGEEAQGNPDELIDFFGGLLQVLDLERLAFDLLRPLSPMSRLRQEERRKLFGDAVSVLKYHITSEMAGGGPERCDAAYVHATVLAILTMLTMLTILTMLTMLAIITVLTHCQVRALRQRVRRRVHAAPHNYRVPKGSVDSVATARQGGAGSLDGRELRR